MKSIQSINHEFVDFIPKSMEPSTLYISMEFATASHLCFCGCGSEVVTPLSPVGWQLWFNGEVVSLSPSIGSWSLPCRSHYWIKNGKIAWAGPMSAKDIAAVRRRDRADAKRHYDGVTTAIDSVEPAPVKPAETKAKRGFWAMVGDFFR